MKGLTKMKYENRFLDCYAVLVDGKLTLGNDAMQRTWDMSDVRPVAQSMVNKKTGKEWLTTKENSQWRKPYERKYVFSSAV